MEARCSLWLLKRCLGDPGRRGQCGQAAVLLTCSPVVSGGGYGRVVSGYGSGRPA